MTIELIQNLFTDEDDRVVREMPAGFSDDDDVEALVLDVKSLDLGDGNDILIGRIEGLSVYDGSFNGIDLNGELDAGNGNNFLLGGVLGFVDADASLDGIDFEAPATFGTGDDGILGYAVGVGYDVEYGYGEINARGVDIDEMVRTGAGDDVVAGAAALISDLNTRHGGTATGVSIEELNTGSGNDLVLGVSGLLVENEGDVRASRVSVRDAGFESVVAGGVGVDDTLSMGLGDDMVVGITLGSASGVYDSSAVGLSASGGDVEIQTGGGDDVLLGLASVNFDGGLSPDAEIGDRRPVVEDIYGGSEVTGVDVARSLVNTGSGDDKILGVSSANLDGLSYSYNLQSTGIDMAGALVQTGSGNDLVLGIGAGGSGAIGIALGAEASERSRSEPGLLRTGGDDDIVIGVGIGEDAVGISGGRINLGAGNDILVAGHIGGDGAGLEGVEILASGGDDMIFVDGGDGVVNGGLGEDTLFLTQSEDELKISTEGSRTYISGDNLSLEVTGIETILFDVPDTETLASDPAVLELLLGEPGGLGDIDLSDTGIDTVLEPLEDHFGFDVPITGADLSVVNLIETVYADFL